MRDWHQFVRERLGPLGLRHEREEEILAEIADHLEDECSAKEEKVLLPPRQLEGIEEGTDWSLLAREIRQAEEETMSPTAKTLWVPGMSMLLCSFILLLAMTRLVPPTTWADLRTPALLLAPWLLSYLVFGALGAWWSRRVGGKTAARLLAGMFPLALHLAVFIPPIIVALIVDVPRFPEHLQLSFLLRAGLGWIVIPGVALALGTAPFLRDTAKA